MSTWLDINETLLAEIANQLMPVPAQRDVMTAVNRELLEAALAYFEEGFDGCDHSVGICQCALGYLIGELRMALDGRQTCRMCAGDTYLYSVERHEEARRLLEAKYGVGAFDYDTESLGFYDCPACAGSGMTPLGTQLDMYVGGTP